MITDLPQVDAIHTVKGFKEVDEIDVQRDVPHEVLLSDIFRAKI